MGNSGRIALTLSALLSLSLGLPVAAHSVPPPITVTDIGSLGGTIGYNYVYGMNESGLVVGSASTSSGYHAYSWTAAGGFKDLGTLKDPVTNLPWSDSTAYSVNDLGQVAGASGNNNGSPPHAVMWSAAGVITDLGTGPNNGYMAWAKVINSKGWVAGEFEATAAPFGRHAFFWSTATGMRDLGSLGGNYLTVTGMNSDGVVVGVAGTAAGYSRAFASKARTGPLKDLGTLGGNNSSASGINDAGKITGNSDSPTGQHAFVYSNNKMTDIHNAALGFGSFGGGGGCGLTGIEVLARLFLRRRQFHK